jgi:hypothetical protein
MKRFHVLVFTTILLLTSAVYFSCRKPIVLDDTDQGFPIQLNGAIVGDSIRMSWDNKRVTNFQRAIIISSEASIPVGLSPFAGLKIELNTNNLDINTFVKAIPLFQNKTFFKVYIEIDNRFIESNSLEINSSSTAFNGRVDVVRFHPDSNWMISIVTNLTNSLPTLTVIDGKNRNILGKVSLNDLNDPNAVSIGFHRYQNEENLLVSTNAQRYLRYRLPDLVLLEETSFSPYYIWSILPTKNDWLLTTQNDYSTAFSIRKLSSVSSIFKYYERPNNYYYPRRLTFLNPDDLSFIEVSSFEIQRNRLNATTGAVISAYSKSATTQGVNPFGVEIPMTRDRAYFIPNIVGAVYDQNLDIKYNLPINQNANTIDFEFSPDGNYVYILEQPFVGFFKSVIRKIEFPNMKEVGSVAFDEVEGRRIDHNSAGDLHFICNSITAPVRFVVLKVNL